MNNSLWLEFVVAEATYALPVSHVIEILTWRECESVPGSEAYVRGVINFRGYVIPVVDMAQWLHGKPIKPTESSKILTMSMADDVVGVAVDDVCELINPDKGKLEVITEGERALSGTCYYQGRIIAMLDWQELTGLIAPDA